MNPMDLVYLDGVSAPRPIPSTLTPVVLACAVGDVIELHAEIPLAEHLVIAVVRAPSGSSAAPTVGTLTPDVAGHYRLAVSNGYAPPRRIELVAFPAAALTDRRIKEPRGHTHPAGYTSDPYPRTEAHIRKILGWYVLEHARRGRDLSGFDALNTDGPLPLSVDWRLVPSGCAA